MFKRIATCIKGTKTLTEGREYEIVNTYNNDKYYEVRNNKGNIVTVRSYRFINLKLKEEKKMKREFIECINRGIFAGLTRGNKYEVVRRDNDFYVIKNDKGFMARYHKRYFVAVKEELPKPPKPKVHKMVCLIPTGKMSYLREYTVKEDPNNPKRFIVKDNEGKEVSLNKNRFAEVK